MFYVFVSTLILCVPVVLATLPASKKQWIVTLGISLPLMFALSYLTLPVLSWSNGNLWGSLFVIYAFIKFVIYLATMDSIDPRNVRPNHEKAISIGVSVVVVAIMVFIFGSSTPIFNGKQHAQILDIKEETQVFDPSAVLMDTTQARFVDGDLALRATKEKLGEKIGLGTRSEIDESSIQSIDGRLVWVSPLTHKSVFKYLSNEAVDGYITVSASKFSDTEATLDQPMKFGTSGFYFNGDVERHLYFSGYHSTFLTDYTLEIDDTGKPFWVVSKYEKLVGVQGKKVIGVVIVDAATGDIQDLPLSEIAEKAPWVDRVQPEAIVMEQIESWGGYQKDFYNYLFVGEGVLNPTDGLSLVYTKDGRSMWYTGLQSGSSQEGTVGFMLVDTKTGEATFYRRTGITEEVAKRAIEGKVQEFGYKASNPIPYNVNGTSTFVSVLKDDKGNPQMIGMVAYDDRSVLAVGENLETVLRRYQLAQSQSGAEMNLGEDRVLVELEGVLDRVGFQQVDAHASLHFTLQNDPEGRVFTVSGSDSARYILSRPGDRVKIGYIDTGSDPIIVREFVNAEL